MNTALKKALKQIPTVIKTTAKKEIGYQASLVPLKAQMHLEQKLKNSLTASINEYKDIPQQIVHELKRQSIHQSRQPFQDNSFYFQQYHYQPQQQRYTSTPQLNLAEILYIREQQTRRY